MIKMAIRRDVLAFYLGIMVGVIGNFLVSSIFEFSKAMFERADGNMMLYGAIMFITSSIAFFQATKIALGQLGFRHPLRIFDVITIVCIVLGLIPIVIFL